MGIGWATKVEECLWVDVGIKVGADVGIKVGTDVGIEVGTDVGMLKESVNGEENKVLIS